MKIIHITAAYKPAYIYGGPTMSVAKLCEELGADIDHSRFNETNVNSAKRSFDYAQDDIFEVEVYTTTANGKRELEVETQQRVIVDDVNVTYFKRLTKDHSHFSPGLLRELRKNIKSINRNPPPTPSKGGHSLTNNEQRPTNIDLIIHIHAWWNLVSVFSCVIAKWYRIPVVLSPRGMLTSYTQSNRNSFAKRIIHWLIGKKLLRYCHIHATSEQEKQDILNIIQPKSLNIISNLVEINGAEKLNIDAESISFSQELNDRKRPIKLIFLSRIEEKKGLDVLFNALAILQFSFSLSIGGSGDEHYINSLKAKAIDLKIIHQITWLGQVKNEDKFTTLQRHDMMVLCSYNENFANVVVESLSVGTPVLLSDQVGLSTYVTENDLGWVTSLNVNDIAKNLKIAYLDVDKRNKIRKLAPSFVAKDFNDKTLAQKYITLYTNIANGRL